MAVDITMKIQELKMKRDMLIVSGKYDYRIDNTSEVDELNKQIKTLERKRRKLWQESLKR